jgi:hypothetical protein
MKGDEEKRMICKKEKRKEKRLEIAALVNDACMPYK